MCSFFFQAEDGIRAGHVTGVQTCALPILTSELLERTKAPFHQVIKDAGISVSEIDHVVMVGGSTRMPAVTEVVKDLTGGKEPNKGVNPDEVVAVGADLQAAELGRAHV